MQNGQILTPNKKTLPNSKKNLFSPRNSIKLQKKTQKTIFLQKSFPFHSKIFLKSENFIQSIQFRTQKGSISGKPKSKNQDEYLINQNFVNTENQTLLGVFDGHGIFGKEVALFVKKHLPLLIEKNFPLKSNY